MLYDIENEYEYWEYKIKKRKWRDILDGDDYHSVYKQIIRLLSNNVKWQAINQLRDLGDDHAYEIYQIIDKWFWIDQLLGIRRVTEQDDSKISRAVYSLRRVIDEIIKDIHLLSRANYINELDLTARSMLLMQAESNFDSISGTTDRTGSEKANVDVFIDLRKQLESQPIKDIRGYANKYIAHSSDPINRKDYEITLELLDNAYKKIIKVLRTLITEFLSGPQLSMQIMFTGDIFKNWEKPFCVVEDQEKLREFIKKRQKEVNDY